MKFGKEFRIHLEETLPEWRDKYLCYKYLKKLLKNIPTTADSIPPPDQQRPVDDHAARALPSLAVLQDWFISILADELDKFNDFYVDKEEDFVIRFQALKERIERLKERSCKNGVLSAESEFSGEIMDIRKDFVTIHGEMVLLKNYSSLNFAGLVKIVKKYDKRTGGLLQFPFANLALHQPFFTTEPLTRLVRECEANLEILFPLEAEVIESATTAAHKVDTTSTATVSNFAETPLPLGGETVDIYRSTLSAIRTIQGLKMSSTSNPLSFASVFGSQDNENDGAVTAENSAASNSSASLHNGAESNQDDGQSIQ